MFCWHKWGRWFDPAATVMGREDGVGWLSVAQIRICDKCGKAAYRSLPRLRSIHGIREEVEREHKQMAARGAGGSP